ncbi:MAG: DUF362 domain-containing protein [Deltaproteobacteria bacterium]|jgi:uncharacterized protein (DUF362 family)|nr:DUF362 domain-containing protein [Deltaproteobacteria bacterium]
MAGEKRAVAISRCLSYDRQEIVRVVDGLLAALAWRCSRGSRVLLKPNLVAARYQGDIACTHPEFVAGVAQWFVDQGAQVVVGDSPATGSGLRAMHICGITAALRGLPLSYAPFQKSRVVTTRRGRDVAVAVDALECDYFINLPKLKSHGQTRVTLAVKNHYGIIKGWRKAWGHQVHGQGDGRAFFDLLADLPFLVPPGLSLCDAITAMHRTGPLGGEAYPLGVMAASPWALALDRALLAVIKLDPESSPLWQASRDRQDKGHDLATLAFPLLSPEEVAVEDFQVPGQLRPVPFHGRHLLASLAARCKVWLARQRENGKGWG